MMSTRTFINAGLLRSGIRRFWPLWLLYLLAWVLLFVAPVLSTVSATAGAPMSLELTAMQESAWTLFIGQLVPLTGISSLVAAICLNEHLFSPKAATFFGRMPARRKSQFGTLYLTGFLPLIAVVAVVYLFIMPICSMSPALRLQTASEWFVLAVGFTFVFYSLAQFICQLTGSAAVAAFLYVLVNVLSVCIETAIKLIASALQFGVLSLEKLVTAWASPGIGLAYYCLWPRDAGGSYLHQIGWLALGAYCLAAVVLAVLAGWLYDKRDLESAGSALAYRVLHPVMKYLAGICGALLLGTFTYLLFWGSAVGLGTVGISGAVAICLSMCVGAMLGVLFSQMVIDRSTRVLGKCWKGATVLAAACVLFTSLCYFDAFGVERYVPRADEVSSAELAISGMRDAELTSNSGIEKMIALHNQILSYGREVKGGSVLAHNTDGDNGGFSMVGITYHLKNGTTKTREYTLAYGYGNDGNPLPGTGVDAIAAAYDIANSREGRYSRFAVAFDRSSGCTFSLSYPQADVDPDAADSGLLKLSQNQAADFVENALKPDLAQGQAGYLVYSLGTEGVEVPATETAASLQINDKDGSFVAEYWLDTEKTPKTVEWFAKNYPDIKLVS